MNVKNPLAPIDSNSDSADLMATLGPPPAALDDPLAIPRKIHGIMRGRYIIAIVLGSFFGLIGGVGGAMATKPTFVSSGYIHVVQRTEAIINSIDIHAGLPQYHNFVNSQVAVILSERVINQAMAHEAWRSTGRGATQEETAKFMKSLVVRHPENSEGIIVAFEDENPVIAQRAVKSVVSAYRELYGEKDLQSLTQRMTALEGLRSRYRDNLESIRSRRKAIGQEFGTDDLRPIYASKQQLVNRLEAERQEIMLVYAAAVATMQKQDGLPQPGALGTPPGALPATSPAPEPGKSNAALASVAPAPDAAKSAANPPAPTTVAASDAMLQEMLKRPNPQAAAAALSIEDIEQLDQQMRGYRQAEENLARQLDQLRLTLGEDHRQVVATKAYLSGVQRDIEEHAATFRKQYTERLLENGPNSLRQLYERFQQVDRHTQAAKQELKEIGQKNLALIEFDQQEDDMMAKLKEVERRSEQLNIEAQTAGRIKVISEGDTPLIPYKDRRVLFGAAAASAGMGFGVAIVFMFGLLDRRFRTIHDAHDNFGRISMLGIMPQLPDDLADPDQAMITARCVHQIRTLLQIGSDSQGRQVYMVTSPGPANGKTSLTLAMGLSFAASDARTLMIDCDLAGGGLTGRIDAIIRRKIGFILVREGLVTQEQLDHALQVGQENNRRLGEMLIELGYLTQADLDEALTLQEETPVGLLDALQGEPLRACVMDTGITNLSILPIGAATIDDVARLSPAAIRKLLEEARKQYDVVLIDTGAMPASLEASHLAPESDAVVLVVSKGENRAQAQKAIDRLQSIGARIAGLVFNRAEQRDMEVLGDSSLSKQSVSGVRRSPVKAAEQETPNRFGPVARAVASGNVRGNSSRPG
jgi:Mrp family chromosome partitioning ATPase/uncharacterized protein involved in exopolysaccharide biosynthesis